MSKKASFKPDYTYHNDDYYVDDGILDEEAPLPDTEYSDWCAQCGNQQLGFIDPATHSFYCNSCWNAFSQPAVSSTQETQETKKKSRRAKKKPKTKKQTQSADTAIEHKTNQTKNNQRASCTKSQTTTKSVKSQQKNTENSFKTSSIFDNRSSLFDDDAISNNDEEKEIVIEAIKYIPEATKSKTKSKPRRKPKGRKAIMIHRDRPFIGSRVESQATYKRHETQKQELIKLRFGSDITTKKRSNSKSRNESKPHINLVVIGHVDAGKSTLMGRLLYEYGVINSKTMHKLKRQSALCGKSSFAYAWVLDCHEEERKRGITVDISTHYFETQHRCITLLDSPGHKDFIPNMISGASQADAAILVINSKVGDFETGFDINNGQTREHAMIAKSLGVQQIIVAVNKMDCCHWNKDRFDLIVIQIKTFLKEIGFINKSKKKKNVIFIPVSGLTGTNLIQDKEKEKKKEKDKWWKCKVKDTYLTHLSLFEVIDALRPSSSILTDSLDGFLRMSITDIYKESNIGMVATGKILSGSIMNNQQILIQPANIVTKIKNIISNIKHKIAIKGDNIQLLLDIKDSNDEIFDQIKVGDIITSPHQPLKLINRFQSKIVTMKNLKIPICKGHHVMIHTQSIEKEAYILRINHLVNKKTGEAVDNKKQVRHIKADQCAIVTIKLRNKNDVILLDTYENLKELGRITIRRDGQTVALGLVETVGV